MGFQVTKEVWATILALIWLHGFKMEAQDEWQLLAMKAVSWVHAQKGNGAIMCGANDTIVSALVTQSNWYTPSGVFYVLRYLHRVTCRKVL